MPELRTARENARLEIGSQRGRNSHQIGVLGIYDLQGLSYDRTELLVADMRLLAPDPADPDGDAAGADDIDPNSVRSVKVLREHGLQSGGAISAGCGANAEAITSD